MARAYLGLGANLGDRAASLQAAVDRLAAEPGLELLAVSSVYETAPVGGPRQPDYLNAVVAVETRLDARSLLAVAQRLEQRAGRVRRERWGPRVLDVDVLVVGEETVADDDLEVPHPRMWERAFVLAPLADIAPDLVDARAGSRDRWTGVRRSKLSLRLPPSP